MRGAMILITSVACFLCCRMLLAQHYLQAEMESHDLDFGGFEENLTEAVDCYELAINVPFTHAPHATCFGGRAAPPRTIGHACLSCASSCLIRCCSH